MSTLEPTIVTGDDSILPVTLKKNQTTFLINSGATVKASVISKDRKEILLAPVTVDVNEVGSDWGNSLIVVTFASADTANIPIKELGGALLEIQVDDGGKLTWFHKIKILQGTIDSPDLVYTPPITNSDIVIGLINDALGHDDWQDPNVIIPPALPGNDDTEFLSNEFSINDFASGYKQSFDTSELTANRELILPDFPFDVSDYFDSTGGILFKSTTAQPASITKSGTYDGLSIRSGGYTPGKYTGGINLISSMVNFYDENAVIYLKVEPTASITKLRTQYGSKLQLESSSGVVGFNGTIQQTDLASGYTIDYDLTNLTGDRVITYPDFDFDFSDWFSTSKTFSATTVNFANGIHTMLQMTHTNSGIVDWKISGVTFYQINTSTGFQVNSTSKLGFCPGFANGTMDTTLERKEEKIIGLNGGISYTAMSSDPSDPADGESVTWVSDGTDSGDAGDVMTKVNVGGTVKIATLIDYSTI